MPYLIYITKWPSHKAGEAVKKAYEYAKKFTPDGSLGVDLTPGNAFKGTLDGIKTLGITNVAKGKLEDAFTNMTAIMNFYATAIEGFEYSIEVWSTEDEAWGSIGQKPPEQG